MMVCLCAMVCHEWKLNLLAEVQLNLLVAYMVLTLSG